MRFIEGVPESHLILARRKGEQWFVGGMTNEARLAKVPLGFLTPGTTYKAQVYRDGATKDELVIEEKTVRGDDTLEVPMLQAGGCAIHLTQAGTAEP